MFRGSKEGGLSAIALCNNLRVISDDLVNLYSNQIVGKSGRRWEHGLALSTVSNLLALWHLLNANRAAKTLEIGLCFGGSAVLFATYHQIQQHAGCSHVAIDPYQCSVWDDSGILALERAGLREYVQVIEQDSCLALAALLQKQEKFDAIYVDGSHLFEDVFVDAYFGTRLLTKGGVIAFDDCSNGHVKRVIRFLRTNCEGLIEVPMSEYCVATMRKRIARRVGRQQMVVFRLKGEPCRAWDSPYIRF